MGGMPRATDPRKASASAGPMRLRILDGPEAGTEYAVTGERVSLGRGDGNDIVLVDENASRNHAELVMERDGRYRVRDLGSRHGVVVNKRRVQEAALASGDRLRIGSTTVEVRIDGAPAAGSPLVRWLAVGGVVVVAAVLFLAMRGGKGPVVVGNSGARTVGSAAPAPSVAAAAPVVPRDPNSISLGSLLSPAASAPAKGVEVGRNANTRPVGVPPPTAATIKSSPADVAAAAALIAEADRSLGSGRLSDAREQIARAIRIDPSCERCVAKLAGVEATIKKQIEDAFAAGRKYLDTARYQDAINQFQKVKLLDPDPASINNGNASRLIQEAQTLKAQSGR